MKEKVVFFTGVLCYLVTPIAFAQQFIISKQIMKTCALEPYVKGMSFKDCCLKYATVQGSTPGDNASNIQSENNAQVVGVGEEELEKLACEYWLGKWSESEKTCEAEKDGGGGRSMAIWDKTEKKYKCLNAIEYRKKLVNDGKKTLSEINEMIDYWRPIIYDNKGLLNSGFQDMQWIIIPYDTSNGKCASIDERQCYQKNGRYNWSEFKCYTHDNDKQVCEENGAKFKIENGVSYCDCQLPNVEFHWNSNGECWYKKGNTKQTFEGNYTAFFMYCLTKNLKDTPVFNGEITYKNCQ